MCCYCPGVDLYMSMCFCFYDCLSGTLCIASLWDSALFCGEQQWTGRPAWTVFSLTVCGCTARGEKRQTQNCCVKRGKERTHNPALPHVNKPKSLFSSPFVSAKERGPPIFPLLSDWGVNVHRLAHVCSLIWAFLHALQICVNWHRYIHLLESVCESLLWVCILAHLYIFMEGSNWVVEDRAQRHRERAGVIEGWAVCLWEPATLPLSPHK